MLSRNVNLHKNSNDKNIMSKMSINVFKKHSGNKITFSDRSALCGELKVVGGLGLR